MLLLPFALTAKWWAPPLLARLAFFQLRKIQVEGVRFIDPRQIALRMRADTLQSLWDDTDILERRIASHPQVGSVTVSRRMPGTLVVSIREIAPVALVPGRSGLEAVDSLGRAMPVNPARSPVDLPVVAGRDTAVLGLLARIRGDQAYLFSRISDAARSGASEILISLSVPATAPTVATPTDTTAAATLPSPAPVLRIRVPVGVSVLRLTDIFPVEIDLARRQAKVVELDLRYRDQVIARLQ